MQHKNESIIPVLIDWCNVDIALRKSLPWEIYSQIDYRRVFQKFEEWLKQFGVLDPKIIFAPDNQTRRTYLMFHSLGYFIEYCPGVPSSDTDDDADSTDGVLIKYAEMIMKRFSKLDYLCIGSGDADFAPVIEKAKEQGTKIIVAAGRKKAIGNPIWKLASTNKITNKPLVYIFGENLS